MHVRPPLLLAITAASFAVAESNATQLIQYILDKHLDTDVAPVGDSAEAVTISVSIGVKSIVNLDIVCRKLLTLGWLTVSWYDKSLVWDLRDYPLSYVSISSDKIWIPELIIVNSVRDLDQLQKEETYVTVRNDGLVTWNPVLTLETICFIDFTFYPVDIQTCSVEVTSWLDPDELTLTFAQPAFNVIALEQQHSEWRLLWTKFELKDTPINQQILCFMITLKRSPVYLVITLLLPLGLLTQIYGLVFLIPLRSGEKMTLSITFLEIFEFFRVIINNFLPHSMDTVSLLMTFVTLQLLVSNLSIWMTVIIIMTHKKEYQVEEEEAVLSDLSRSLLTKLPRLCSCAGHCCGQRSSEALGSVHCAEVCRVGTSPHSRCDHRGLCINRDTTSSAVYRQGKCFWAANSSEEDSLGNSEDNDDGDRHRREDSHYGDRQRCEDSPYGDRHEDSHDGDRHRSEDSHYGNILQDSHCGDRREDSHYGDRREDSHYGDRQSCEDSHYGDRQSCEDSYYGRGRSQHSDHSEEYSQSSEGWEDRCFLFSTRDVNTCRKLACCQSVFSSEEDRCCRSKDSCSSDMDTRGRSKHVHSCDLHRLRNEESLPSTRQVEPDQYSICCLKAQPSEEDDLGWSEKIGSGDTCRCGMKEGSSTGHVDRQGAELPLSSSREEETCRPSVWCMKAQSPEQETLESGQHSKSRGRCTGEAGSLFAGARKGGTCRKLACSLATHSWEEVSQGCIQSAEWNCRKRVERNHMDRQPHVHFMDRQRTLEHHHTDTRGDGSPGAKQEDTGRRYTWMPTWRSTCFRQLWSLYGTVRRLQRKSGRLTAAEWQQLSSSLNDMCFTLTVAIETLVLLVFIAIILLSGVLQTM